MLIIDLLLATYNLLQQSKIMETKLLIAGNIHYVYIRVIIWLGAFLASVTYQTTSVGDLSSSQASSDLSKHPLLDPI